MAQAKGWATSPASGGTVANNDSGTSTLSIGNGNGGGGTYQGILADNTTGSGGKLALYKTGSGTITLSGANTYRGGTTVSGGTLQLGNNSALGAATGPLTITSATLDLNGNGPTVGALTGNAGALIVSSVTGGSLTVSQATPTTYSGTISNGAGTVALELTGGTLYLSGGNAYTGGTTVANGELILTNSEAIEGGTSLSVGDDLSAFRTVVPAAAGRVSESPATATVPEPGTLALLAAGALVAFAAWRRKKELRQSTRVTRLPDPQAGAPSDRRAKRIKSAKVASPGELSYSTRALNGGPALASSLVPRYESRVEL